MAWRNNYFIPISDPSRPEANKEHLMELGKLLRRSSCSGVIGWKRISRKSYTAVKSFLKDKLGGHNSTRSGDKFMPVTRRLVFFWCFFHIVPFRWNPASQRLTALHRFSWKRFHLCIAVCLLLIDVLFIIFRLIQLFLENKGQGVTDSRIFKHAISLFSQLGPKFVALLVCFTVIARDVAHTVSVNSLLKIRRSVNLVKDFPAAKPFVSLYFLRALQMSIVSIIKPKKLQFWYSALSAKTQANNLIFTIHWMFHIQVSLLQFIIIFVMFQSLSFRPTLQGAFQARSPSNLLKLISYRQAQVLQNVLVEAVGPVTAVSTMYIKLVSVTYCYGCVRYYETLDFRVFLHLPISLLITIIFAQALYNSLGKIPITLKEARQKYFGSDPSILEGVDIHQNKEKRIYLESCPVVPVLGIRKIHFLYILRFVVFQTTRLLIVTGRK